MYQNVSDPLCATRTSNSRRQPMWFVKAGVLTLSSGVSDLGWHLGERNMWEKKGLDELDCRVPLLIRVPWLEAASSGRVRDTAFALSFHCRRGQDTAFVLCFHCRRGSDTAVAVVCVSSGKSGPRPSR